MPKTITIVPSKACLDHFTAVSIAEGFCGGEDASDEEKIEAWQYLIDTGLAWQLQGWYGRSAQAMIDAGVCTPAGKAATV